MIGKKVKDPKSGLVYAPYIMSIDISESVTGDDFKPSKKLLSRYAVKVMKNSIYGTFGVEYPSTFEENLDNIIDEIENRDRINDII